MFFCYYWKFYIFLFSGILKVTPSHDFVDYDIAKRHHDIFGNNYLSCINEEGKLIDAGKFNGIDRLEVKPKVCICIV